MALTYIDWEREGVLVLALTGELRLGAATGLFRQLIEDAVTLGKNRIVLNLKEISYIDSSGLGELVAAHDRIGKAKGALKLSNLHPRMQQILHSTRLYMIFDIFDTEDGAVASFPPV